MQLPARVRSTDWPWFSTPVPWRRFFDRNGTFHVLRVSHPVSDVRVNCTRLIGILVSVWHQDSDLFCGQATFAPVR